MAGRRRPKKGPRRHVVLQGQKAKPYERGSTLISKKMHLSRFSGSYTLLEMDVMEKSGGGFRIYPGGADYPVITYTKYEEDGNERELNSEPWESFAASVSYILVKRKEA